MVTVKRRDGNGTTRAFITCIVAIIAIQLVSSLHHDDLVITIWLKFTPLLAFIVAGFFLTYTIEMS